MTAARNLAAALMVVACVSGGVATAQTTTTAASGDTVTIGVGSRDGVRVGMTGRITKQEMVGGTLQSFEIARFQVTAVESTNCMGRLTDVGEGFRVEPGMDVVFDQRLVPPEPTATPTPRPPAATPTPRLPSDPVELLRQGTTAWDRQDWARALEFYEALLRQVPGHPIAVERSAAARTKIEVAEREAEARRREEELARRDAEERARRERAEREALERERRNVPLYRETARIYIDAGQWDKAAEWLRKIAAVEPADAYLQSVLEKELQAVERDLADGRFDAAEAGLEALRGLLPEVRSAAASGRITAAREAAEVAQVEALVAEGDWLLAAGDRDGARQAWVQARKLRPAHPGLAQRLDGVMPQAGAEWTDPAVGMRFRYVPAGSFEMGSPAGEKERGSDERQHRVTITRGYWMGETEVTQGQWRAVMGTSPSHFSSCGESCPVEMVSWFEAVEYANRLSRKAGLAECYRISGESVSFVGLGCEGYRLPTEAEWEYAARAGTTTPFWTGSNLTTEQANYDGNYPYVGGRKGIFRQRTVPVKTFSPNVWGLFGVHGNVWEWVWDRYLDYPAGYMTDPTGPSSALYAVLRGGGWANMAGDCRSANRIRGWPGTGGTSLGLRLVRTAG